VLTYLSHDPAANATLLAIAERFPSGHALTETASIPFDSKRKWKAVQFSEYGSWFLGAPEMLMGRDDDLQKLVEEKASLGQRILLLASSQHPLAEEELPADITAAALISIEEEIRDDAPDTISFFHQQNVEVYVLSGDHPSTVAAVARKVGVNEDRVFGRVTPEQKREFVQNFHAKNDVVAMTGDGVNDVLALKDADIGIAMDNAAPATKAVAELILLDGKFSHLPHVIAEGRRVIGNVERVAHVFLTKNVMSIVSILSVALLSRQFPFLPRQMTLVSSLAIGIPAFFLAIGTSSERYVPGLLHRVISFAVPAGFITGIGVIVADAISSSGGTASSITALIAFLWIISIFARPFTPTRTTILVTMTTASALAFIVPISAEFFDLSFTATSVIPGVVCGVIAAIGIEIVHRLRH
jgi:cation-transporting ATPase E